MELFMFVRSKTKEKAALGQHEASFHKSILIDCLYFYFRIFRVQGESFAHNFMISIFRYANNGLSDVGWFLNCESISIALWVLEFWHTASPTLNENYKVLTNFTSAAF